MAVETIKQILAPSGAPNINGVRARAKLAEALLEDIYQGLVETNERGVTDRFTKESDVNENAQIFVTRILPAKIKAREMGASKNGGSFSQYQHYTQTVNVGIDVLQVIDDPIIIPRARQDLINVDLLAKQTDLYVKRLNTIINGATACAKLHATWQAEVAGKEINKVNISSADVTNKAVLERFIECNDLLDLGDSENGIDVFPEETRIAVFKNGSRAVLKGAGILTLGGANYAYDIARGGALSTEAKKTTQENGYWGDIDGVAVHGLSGESLGHASQFLGLPEQELAKSHFFGYVASSYANARGVSTVDQIKVVDTIGGQGLELQPFTKLGAVSWYAKGNVIITKDAPAGAKGYYSYYKSIFGDTDYAKVSFKLKGAGSRLFPVISTLTADASDGKIYCSATAVDDAFVEHLVAGYYVQSDTGYTTVESFCEAAVDASVVTKGSLTDFGSTGTTAVVTATKHITVLLIADDGSVALKDCVVSA